MIAVAIDGPAGAGKSSIARAVAKKKGYIYVDTGALYRTIGLYCIRKGISYNDAESVLSEIKVELKYENGEQAMYLLGENVTSLIRTEEVSMAASAVSAVPAVRAFLLETQRDLARKNNVIMDGRDIATVVLPDAKVKIFLTASPECRAKRRVTQLAEKGIIEDYNKVLEEVNTRDYNDSHRAVAPLKPSEESVVIDTTEDSFEDSVEKILAVIEEKTGE
ncbi:MAG: (d)CMP kinase [Oscillospiraceae bacterium]|nr:(d)CMP kinase [Oscillospiraceae bacterium]